MAESARRPIKTFSIGFERARFDELRHARRSREHFGTEHHELVVRAARAGLLPTLVRHYGEPYADSSAIPTYYVAEMARRARHRGAQRRRRGRDAGRLRAPPARTSRPATTGFRGLSRTASAGRHLSVRSAPGRAPVRKVRAPGSTAGGRAPGLPVCTVGAYFRPAEKQRCTRRLRPAPPRSRPLRPLVQRCGSRSRPDRVNRLPAVHPDLPSRGPAGQGRHRHDGLSSGGSLAVPRPAAGRVGRRAGVTGNWGAAPAKCCSSGSGRLGAGRPGAPAQAGIRGAAGRLASRGAAAC